MMEINRDDILYIYKSFISHTLTNFWRLNYPNQITFGFCVLLVILWTMRWWIMEIPHTSCHIDKITHFVLSELLILYPFIVIWVIIMLIWYEMSRFEITHISWHSHGICAIYSYHNFPFWYEMSKWLIIPIQSEMSECISDIY